MFTRKLKRGLLASVFVSLSCLHAAENPEVGAWEKEVVSKINKSSGKQRFSKKFKDKDGNPFSVDFLVRKGPNMAYFGTFSPQALGTSGKVAYGDIQLDEKGFSSTFDGWGRYASFIFLVTNRRDYHVKFKLLITPCRGDDEEPFSTMESKEVFQINGAVTRSFHANFSLGEEVEPDDIRSIAAALKIVSATRNVEDSCMARAMVWLENNKKLIGCSVAVVMLGTILTIRYYSSRGPRSKGQRPSRGARTHRG